MSQRTLTLQIFRHNPRDPDSQPHLQSYTVEEIPGMTLFVVLTRIREDQDPTLSFDFVCRAGICGSCAMVINGRPGLACRTLTESLPTTITLLPLPGFELIGDLSVNTGRWMRGLSERLQAWIQQLAPANVDALEAPMDPDVAEQIYEIDRCVECGCCIAACGNARMREDFIGAVGFNKVVRFRADPRDTRSDADWYEIIGDDNGIFGCLTLLGCQDVCPKGLSLQTQIAFLRRKMVTASFA